MRGIGSLAVLAVLASLGYAADRRGEPPADPSSTGGRPMPTNPGPTVGGTYPMAQGGAPAPSPWKDFEKVEEHGLSRHPVLNAAGKPSGKFVVLPGAARGPSAGFQPASAPAEFDEKGNMRVPLLDGKGDPAGGYIVMPGMGGSEPPAVDKDGRQRLRVFDAQGKPTRSYVLLPAFHAHGPASTQPMMQQGGAVPTAPGPSPLAPPDP